MEIKYRKSKDGDSKIIKELVGKRFGNRDAYNVTANLDGRYLLAFDGDKLIAMTGIMYNGFYNGPEIDRTCIDKEYEGNGIITLMLSQLLKDIKSDVYCSCWRLGYNNKVNLDYQMKTLGFEPAIYERVRFNSKYHDCSSICVNYKEGCFCCEDLYIRKYKEDNE